jgi:hypothetical protein
VSSGVFFYMSKPVNQKFHGVYRVHDNPKSSPLAGNYVLYTSHPLLVQSHAISNKK